MKFKQFAQRLRLPVNQRGYMLVGLMAAMTITMIGLAAAGPQASLDTQREREEELLWRGQQIAMALAQFRGLRGGQLPTSLEELVEGVNTGVKKMRFLRPHALCDPMLPCTPGKSNWRLVHPGDPVLASMMQSLQSYLQKKQEYPLVVRALTDSINALALLGVPQTNMPNAALGQSVGIQPQGVLNPDPNNPNASQNDSAFGGIKSEKGPIVGVVSRSRDKVIRAMLDIEQYDKGVFFAGAKVMAGGFVTPFFSVAQQPQAVVRCDDGGIRFPDPTAPGGYRCFGGVGRVNRDPEKQGTPAQTR